MKEKWKINLSKKKVKSIIDNKWLLTFIIAFLIKFIKYLNILSMLNLVIV